MPEDIRVPWFIDSLARHRAKTMRMLAYMALAGREGVLDSPHLAVSALTTPGASIRVAPGAFGVLNTAVGGAYEAYVDKFTTEIVRGVSATDATVGGRTDLVIARIKNPFVSGTGTYPAPSSTEDGPYWDIDVIEGVAPNVQSVHVHNPAWSAITLARITRPINTGVVQQSHITDLRSLVDLSGERLIIIDNPPPEPPPIAQQLWTEAINCPGSSQHLKTQTSFHDWPSEAVFTVPVPSWAKGADMFVTINPEIDGNVYGDLRMTIDGAAVSSPSILYNYNYARTIGPEQYQTSVVGTIAIPAGKAGKNVTFRMQARSLANDSAHPGKMTTHAGCYVYAQLNFKKYPVY